MSTTLVLAPAPSSALTIAPWRGSFCIQAQISGVSQNVWPYSVCGDQSARAARAGTKAAARPRAARAVRRTARIVRADVRQHRLHALLLPALDRQQQRARLVAFRPSHARSHGVRARHRGQLERCGRRLHRATRLCPPYRRWSWSRRRRGLVHRFVRVSKQHVCGHRSAPSARCLSICRALARDGSPRPCLLCVASAAGGGKGAWKSHHRTQTCTSQKRYLWRDLRKNEQQGFTYKNSQQGSLCTGRWR